MHFTQTFSSELEVFTPWKYISGLQIHTGKWSEVSLQEELNEINTIKNIKQCLQWDIKSSGFR